MQRVDVKLRIRVEEILDGPHRGQFLLHVFDRIQGPEEGSISYLGPFKSETAAVAEVPTVRELCIKGVEDWTRFYEGRVVSVEDGKGWAKG